MADSLRIQFCILKTIKKNSCFHPLESILIKFINSFFAFYYLPFHNTVPIIQRSRYYYIIHFIINKNTSKQKIILVYLQISKLNKKVAPYKYLPE